MIRRYEIVDIHILSGGRKAYIVSSDTLPIVHVGDTMIDGDGNKSSVTGVGGVTKCFGDKYCMSVLLSGNVTKGPVRVTANHENEK